MKKINIRTLRKLCKFHSNKKRIRDGHGVGPGTGYYVHAPEKTRIGFCKAFMHTEYGRTFMQPNTFSNILPCNNRNCPFLNGKEPNQTKGYGGAVW